LPAKMAPGCQGHNENGTKVHSHKVMPNHVNVLRGFGPLRYLLAQK